MKASTPLVGGLSARDLGVPLRYLAESAALMGAFGLRQGPLQMLRLLKRYPWLKVFARINRLHDRLTRGRRGPYREANGYVVAKIVECVTEMLDGLFSRPSETVLHEDLVPPEILLGMGLNPWMVEFLGIAIPIIEASGMEPYIDEAEVAGIPADVCSLPKSTVGVAVRGEMPQPVAMVTSNMPCDAGMAQYAVIERALQVPTYSLDVPYRFYDERAVSYFAGELHRMVAWLEEHTPGRMDWDRMREVCERRNQAVEYELELWELLRARPAPMAAEPVYLSHLMYGVARPGTQTAVDVFERVSRLARQNLDANRGALADERYRVALWNPPTMSFFDLFSWAERSYGVAMVMDMLTYNRHPFVDTTSPETMLRDLASIIMQGPMARHTRGPAENFFSDLFQLYEYFDLDIIWMAGHVGCKNTQALGGIFREQCRKRKIPLLHIDYDLSDTRIASAADIRRQVAQFMETVMGAERLDGKDG
jgi:benzoyl-CoA reductase/2-hydroxyglutaryl-CoA dehydratase subunit BcrC/BadD/HgdB